MIVPLWRRKNATKLSLALTLCPHAFSKGETSSNVDCPIGAIGTMRHKVALFTMLTVIRICAGSSEK